MENLLKVALAQISPVWLNKKATLVKIEKTILEASTNKAELVVFGEALLPGYPFWLALTNGAAWDLKVNKEIHAHYVRNAVQIEAGELDSICLLAREHKIAIYLGIMERAKDRGGHSIYCSLVYINALGEIKSVHRKLQPTYDERLTWAPGDGNGLQVHPLKQFTVGGLNCWENWMPLPRAALYGQGENLHIAVSSLMKKEDFPKDTPYLNEILEKAPEVLADGGSCIAGPDGEWILEPVVNKEGLIYQTLDFNRVYGERQNFDPVGHYSRPDVTKLYVNRERQSTVEFKD
jgi:nitrilase